MPIPSLSLVQQLIRSSPVLASAISEGSIQVIYREPPVISGDRLFATWTIDILLLDESISDLVEKAVRRQGFETVRNGEQLRCKRDWLLTDQDRADLAAEDQAAANQQKERQREAASQQQADTIAELQAQINQLREELELLQLMPAKRGPAGPAGAAGPAGRDGRDGTDLTATSAKLSDLQDVSEEPGNQGYVLTWSDVTDQWEPKPPRIGGMAMPGGGGGARLVSDLDDVSADLPTNGQLLVYNATEQRWEAQDLPQVNGLQFWTENAQGDLIPSGGNATRSIGSQGKEVKEIWVSGGTIYIDAFPLAVTNQGRITFDGNELAYGNPDVPIDADGGTIVGPN
ncbi:MAG: hypothetical protein ACPGSE_00530 [Synechococcus sp.]